MFAPQQTPIDLEIWGNINPSKLTINYIFSHNHNCVHKLKHKELSNYVIEEVERMLTCGERGYCVYESRCGEIKIIHFGCNSRMQHCRKHFRQGLTALQERHSMKLKTFFSIVYTKVNRNVNYGASK